MSIIADSFLSFNSVTFLSLIVIFGLQFIVIIYLLVNQKSKAGIGGDNKNIIAENSLLKDKNSAMIGQIEILKSKVRDLETANIDLNLQKELLLQSKTNLEELQVKKDELIEMAIHDIKNPASAIKGYVELLESYDLNAVEQHGIMHTLFEISSQIIEITKEMSGLIKQNIADSFLKFAKISIPDIITRVIRNNDGYAQTKGIILQNKVSGKFPDAEADGTKIHEVIENLINNGIKYSPKGTVVKVNAFFNESQITVEISNNGFGLSPEDLGNVFKKGATLSTTPTGGEGRSGLGLWIVKKIIDEHGGTTKVSSTIGNGSVFSFTIPLAQKPNRSR